MFLKLSGSKSGAIWKEIKSWVKEHWFPRQPGLRNFQQLQLCWVFIKSFLDWLLLLLHCVGLHKKDRTLSSKWWVSVFFYSSIEICHHNNYVKKIRSQSKSINFSFFPPFCCAAGAKIFCKFNFHALKHFEVFFKFHLSGPCIIIV